MAAVSPILIALLPWGSACRGTVPAELATDSSGDATGIETTAAPAMSSTDADESSTSAPTTAETTGASTCGDGELQADEGCDDGINDGAYGGCLPDCSAPAGHCGDGLVQPEGDEGCDDGEYNGATSCNAWCQISGTKLAEVSPPIPTWLGDAGEVLATDGGQIFVSTYYGRELWAVRDLDPELSSEHLLVHPWPWRSGALADLGGGRIAVAGGMNADHDLWVLDTEPFNDDDSMPAWVYHHDNGFDGGVRGLVLVDDELWMFGDEYESDRQERAIHRIDPYGETWTAPIVTEWIGLSSPVRPRAILHPSTGLIAVFQARSGLGGLGMRASVLDPSTAEELSFQQDPTLDQPNTVCLRPNGQLAVFALSPEAAWSQQVVGYDLDEDGSLHRGASQTLDLGSGNTFVASCVSGPDVNLLVGAVDGNAFVLVVEDLLGEQQSVVWQHIGVQIGFDAKEAAYGAAYRDGRFYVSLGSEAALATFAR